MKSSFSRTFTTAATILLLALTVLGAAFQLQVNNYFRDTTVASLQQDAEIIANLAAAYSVDGHLVSQEFLVNLDVTSRVTDADVVICDQRGFIILCSDALTGCEHQGMRVSNQDYLQRVISNSGDTAKGMIRGLYNEERFVAAEPIFRDNEPIGIVLASTPTAVTNQLLNRCVNS